MKNKTTITIISSVVLSIALLVVFSQILFAVHEKVEASVIIENPTYSFGDIDINGGDVITTYKIKNTGDSDVQILSAITSCMCTTGQIDDLVFSLHGSNNKKITIPAGGEKELFAIFDPLAHGPNATGPITRELTIKTNSTKTPVLTARFSGLVIKK